jgi:hypothetical protein
MQNFKYMALEDIIPLDALMGKLPQYGNEEGGKGKKKKKIDREAMASPMMRIPRMDVRVARDLIDLGIKELYELQGRAPETLFEEVLKMRPDTPDWRLPYIRMGVYFAENENPEPSKLHPQEWME